MKSKLKNLRISHQIATKILDYEEGKFGCVDGRKITHKAPDGSPYFENDPCFPDFVDNILEARQILDKLRWWQITKFHDRLYQCKMQLKDHGYVYECTGESESRAIVNTAALVWDIETS
jgi:hypothetical protein